MEEEERIGFNEGDAEVGKNTGQRKCTVRKRHQHSDETEEEKQNKD